MSMMRVVSCACSIMLCAAVSAAQTTVTAVTYNVKHAGRSSAASVAEVVDVIVRQSPQPDVVALPRS